MPISYSERKKRRQAMLQGFPVKLRQRLALRHVEAVARLSIDTQRTLGDSLAAGLRRIPAAIAHLQEHPQASVEDVLHASLDGYPAATAATVSRHNLPSVSTERDPDALAELAGLLQDCFPGMPAMTANALAADELLSEVLAVVRARQACFASTHIQSELVFVALCGLALRFMDELNRLMASNPHYRGALAQSGIETRFNHNGHKGAHKGHNGF